MPQKHVGGHILDDRGNRAGRWDDNVHGVRQWAMSHGTDMDEAEEAWRRSGQSHRPVVKRVEGYYEANKHRADRGHGENWLRVLVAFGQYQERGIKPYSAAEAWESAKVWGGWEEVAQALEGLESTNFEFAHGYDPAAGAYAQDGTDGYVAPDDERWGNERQAEDDNASQIAPEHVDRFCEWLERERALVAKECGSGHPAIKCEVYEHYIEDVRSGERVHSQIMFNYEHFLGWLRGEYPQRTAKETSLWADGREEDHTQLSADDAPALDPAFTFDGTFITDTRAGVVIPFDKVAERRDELTKENVRYRLDTDAPDRVRRLSWLALNHEGCWGALPHNTETKTRMVPAEEVPSLIRAGTVAPVTEHPFAAPNRLEIPFRFSNDSCVGEAWSYHENGIRDGGQDYLDDPVWLRWLKAVDATDADVRPLARKDVNIKQEVWMGWHKFGAALTSYLAAKRRWDSNGGRTDAEVQVDWAKRTQEILARAVADAPTPEDIEAAMKAGDWHKVAELAKAKAEAQTPPEGYVWFGRVRQGEIESGQYIAIGDGVYDEAILYLASSWSGEKPRLYQQNAIKGPCRVRHTYDWNDIRREGPYLRTWEEIRAAYDNI